MKTSKYKNTEIGLIPEDWEVKKLGDCAFVTKLAGFEYSLHFNSYKDQGEIIVVRGTNITHNKLDLSDIKTIPRKTSNNLQRSKLNKNDLVFAYVGTIGPIFLVEEDDRFHLGPNTSKITVNRELDSKYLFHFFTSTFLKKEIIEHTSIGAQPSLSMFKIRSFKILTPPSLPEQKAIATALSDTDALISSLEQLISKKRAIKQGAMHELLKPKDGWEVMTLGNIGEIKMCKRVFSYQTSQAENIPFYKIGTFGKTPDSFISHQLYLEYRLKYPFPKKGDILISASGTIGRTVVFDGKDSYFQDSNIIWLENSEKLLSNKLLFYIYQVVKYNTEGGTIQRLYNDIIKKTKIVIPISTTEQTRIATILSDMDTEIENLEDRLHKYKQIKQGMMQQLLTGKIRLV